MKLNRHKRFRRILRFYKVHYRLEAPYTLVVDSEFIQTALKGKVHIKDQIPKVLQDKCFPRVTGCTINALRLKGDQYSGAQLIAKRFDKIQCNHNKPIGESECIAEMLKSKTLGAGVCAGVQDLDLRTRIRCQFHYVPIFYIMGQVPILEEPASFAKGNAKEQGIQALQPSQWEQKALGISPAEQTLPALTTRKKRKEPNPLSCKKKKRKVENVPDAAPSRPVEAKKTRRKHRKRNVAAGTSSQSETATGQNHATTAQASL